MTAVPATQKEGSPAPGKPSSPCVRVCIVDGASGLCLGCLRTLPEIAKWSGLSEAERSTIMALLPSRAAQVAPEKRALAHPSPFTR